MNGKRLSMIDKISGNKFTDSNSNTRFLFELECPDCEQMDVHQLENYYSKLKFNLNRMNSFEKIYYLDGQTFCDSSNESEKVLSKKSHSNITDFIGSDNIYSNLVFKDDFLKLNGIYFRFIRLSLEDEHQISMNDFQKFGDYFVIFEKIKTSFSKILVNDARKMKHSTLYSALSDIEGIESYRENEEMLRKIITRQEELFKSEIHFVIREISENDLFQKTQDLLSSLEEQGFSPKIVTHALTNTFNNFMPGVTPKFSNHLIFHSSLLLNIFPIHQDFAMKNGTTFNARSGKECSIDINQGDSYSLVVTGRTGSGKTVFVQKMLTDDIKNGRNVFIIDPKGDYQKFALLNGASIINESFNPMMFKDPMYLRNIILSKIPKNERDGLFSGKLLHAIRKQKSYLKNNFFEALETLKNENLNDIEFYFEDIKENISNKTIELSKLTYIDYSAFTSEALPFLLSFAFEYVRRLNSPYNLVIDEAHRVFEHDPSFLQERVREMRVQLSSLTTITQKYLDLTSNHFGEVVADNSYHKVFFNQNIDVGKGIDEFDKEQIQNLTTVKGHFSEFYYKNETIRKVLRYYPTIKELEVFNSEKYEKSKLIKFIEDNKKYFSIDECINIFIRNKYAI